MMPLFRPHDRRPTMPFCVLTPAYGETVNALPLIAGRGHPCATVRVCIDGESVLKTTVGLDGCWQIRVPFPLCRGPHVLVATHEFCGCISRARIPFRLASTVLPPIPVIVTPPDGAVICDRCPVISGVASPGHRVRIRLSRCGDIEVCAQSNGRFIARPIAPLMTGEYRLTVTQTDPSSGLTSSEATSRFTIAACC